MLSLLRCIRVGVLFVKLEFGPYGANINMHTAYFTTISNSKEATFVL